MTRRRALVNLWTKLRITVTDESADAIFADIAAITPGYVGADIEGLCREAGILTMQERAGSVSRKHFDQALAKVHRP